MSVFASRRFQVSSRACDIRGRAPAVPATSLTSTSTSPGSISRPDCRAGASTAARSPSSVMAPRRYRLRSRRRAKAGYAEASASRSARIATTSRPCSDQRTSPARNAAREASSGLSEKTSSHWSTTSTVRSEGRGRVRSVAAGSFPGVMTVTRWPWSRSAAPMPARASEDFPLPGRADDGDRSALAQDVQAGAHGVVAAEEGLVVVEVERQQASVGAGARRRHRSAGQQGLVLPEDRLLQRGELRTGVDPELLGEHPLDAVDGPQRLGLPARLVLGQRQQLPAPLAQGRFPDHGLGRREHLEVPPRPQRGLDAQLLRFPPQLLQPLGLDAGEVRELQVLEGGPAPQRERLAQQVRRAVRFAQRQQLATADDESLEPPGVDVVRRHGQRVTLRGCPDHVAAERLTDPEDAALKRLVRRSRGFLPPHRLDELVLRHRLADADRQGREDRSVPASERDAAVAHHGPEDADAHGCELSAHAAVPSTAEEPQRNRCRANGGPEEPWRNRSVPQRFPGPTPVDP